MTKLFDAKKRLMAVQSAGADLISIFEQGDATGFVTIVRHKEGDFSIWSNGTDESFFSWLGFLDYAKTYITKQSDYT
jgi:hypothetical protein